MTKLFIVFFMLPGFATAVEGTFHYKDAKVSLVRHIEKIYIPSPEGQARRKELINQGYACAPAASDIVRCQKIINDPTGSSEFLKTFKPDFSQITLGTLKSMNVLFQAENYVEYEADQQVVIQNTTYNKAKYIELKNIVKFTVDEMEPIAFVVTKEGVVNTLQETVHFSQWVSKIYSVDALYSSAE